MPDTPENPDPIDMPTEAGENINKPQPRGTAFFPYYICPLIPPVLKLIEERTQSSFPVIYLKPKERADFKYSIPILSDYSIYIDVLWKPEDDDLITWERAYHILITGTKPDGSPETKKVLDDGIFIHAAHPTDDRYILRSYWVHTRVSARNGGYLTPHDPYVFQVQRPATSLTELAYSGDRVDFWVIKLQDKYKFMETQPVVRPGEWLVVQWETIVNHKTFNSSGFYGCPYETPLFTGGWIRYKMGDSINVRYAVEIFGQLVSNIIPTDLYDYKVGKWCYLIKVNNSIKKDEKKQDFGSSNVEFPSDKNTSFGEIIARINSERKSRNLVPLFSNSFLEKVAQTHSDAMKTANTSKGSSNPDIGGTVEDRVGSSDFLQGFKPGTTRSLQGVCIYERKLFEHGEINPDATPNEIFYNFLQDNDAEDIITSADYSEIGIGMAKDEPDVSTLDAETAVFAVKKFYYTIIGSYRSDGINIGCEVNGDYRLCAYNFEGPMGFDMAIKYQNELKISSSNEFARVFDMQMPLTPPVIKSVDYAGGGGNGSAVVNFDGQDRTVQIDFHCSRADTFKNGGFAFDKDDEVHITIPIKESAGDEVERDYENARIVAHASKLKSCYKIVILCCSWSEKEAFAWDLILDRPVIEYIRVGQGENAKDMVMAELEQLGFEVSSAVYITNTTKFDYKYYNLNDGTDLNFHEYPNPYQGNAIPSVLNNAEYYDDGYEYEMSFPPSVGYIPEMLEGEGYVIEDFVSGEGITEYAYVEIPNYLSEYKDFYLTNSKYEFELTKSTYYWQLQGNLDIDHNTDPNDNIPDDPFSEEYSDIIRDRELGYLLDDDFRGDQDIYDFFISDGTLERDEFGDIIMKGLINEELIYFHSMCDVPMVNYSKILTTPKTTTLTESEKRIDAVRENLNLLACHKFPDYPEDIYDEADRPPIELFKWNRDFFYHHGMDGGVPYPFKFAIDKVALVETDTYTFMQEGIYCATAKQKEVTDCETDVEYYAHVDYSAENYREIFRFLLYDKDCMDFESANLLKLLNDFRSSANNVDPKPDPLVLPLMANIALTKMAKKHVELMVLNYELGFELFDEETSISDGETRLKDSNFLKYNDTGIGDPTNDAESYSDEFVSINGMVILPPNYEEGVYPYVDKGYKYQVFETCFRVQDNADPKKIFYDLITPLGEGETPDPDKFTEEERLQIEKNLLMNTDITDIGIAVLLDKDTDPPTDGYKPTVYVSMVFGFNRGVWAGMSPMDTTKLVEYRNTWMKFDNYRKTGMGDDNGLKSMGMWHVPVKIA